MEINRICLKKIKKRKLNHRKSNIRVIKKEL